MVAVNRIETVVDYFGGPGRKERRDRLAGEVACSRPPLGRFLTPGAGPWTRTTPRQYFHAAPLHMKSSSARKRAPAPVFGENLSCTDDVCCAPPCPSLLQHAAACCWVPRLTLERFLHTKTPASFALGTVKDSSDVPSRLSPRRLAATTTPCLKPVCPLLDLSPDPAVAALSHER
jgi:hypothetical protein